jgi:hypothetical protein
MFGGDNERLHATVGFESPWKIVANIYRLHWQYYKHCL